MKRRKWLKPYVDRWALCYHISPLISLGLAWFSDFVKLFWWAYPRKAEGWGEGEWSYTQKRGVSVCVCVWMGRGGGWGGAICGLFLALNVKSFFCKYHKYTIKYTYRRVQYYSESKSEWTRLFKFIIIITFAFSFFNHLELLFGQGHFIPYHALDVNKGILAPFQIAW